MKEKCSQFAQLEAAKNNLEMVLSVTKSEQQRLQKMQEAAETSFKKIIEEVRLENDGLKKQVTDLLTTKANLEAEVSSKVESFAEQIISLKSEITFLKKERSNSDQAAQELRETNLELTSKYQAVTTLRDKWAFELNAASLQNNALSQQLSEVKAERDAEASQRRELNRLYETAQVELVKATQSSATLRQELDTQNLIREKVSKSAELNATAVTRLERLHDEVSKERDALKDALELSRKKIADLETINSYQDSQLQQSSSLTKSLQTASAAMSKELDQHKYQLAQEHKQVVDLEAEKAYVL